MVKRVKQPEQLKLKGLSSILGSRALLPTGTVVNSSHMGINSVSSSIELDARNVQPHQRTIKSIQKQENHTWKAWTCLAVVKCFKSWSCSNKKEVSDCSARLRREEMNGPKTLKGRPEQQDFTKNRITERSTVSLYLDELPS